MTLFQREYSRVNNARLVAILAGGESLRMGRDKAQMRWRGVPLLQHLCREAEGSGAQVFVAGRAEPTDWPLENVEFLRDDVPHLGPLGGLQSALYFAKQREYSRVLCIACDMPLLDSVALGWLFNEAEKRDVPHGLIVLRDGNIEPLFSIYPTRCLPLVENRLREKRRSLRGLIESGEFAKLEAPPHVARQLSNLNTPEEWRAAEEEAAREYSRKEEKR